MSTVIWCCIVISCPFLADFFGSVLFNKEKQNKTPEDKNIEMFPPELKRKLCEIKTVVDQKKLSQEEKNKKYREDEEDRKMRQTRIKKLFKEEEESKLPEGKKEDKNDDKKSINNNVNIIVDKEKNI